MEFKTIEERNAFIEENKNLVHHAIKFYIDNPSRQGIHTYEDLAQIGYLKLIDIVESYDESKNSFSDYAVTSIKNHILNAIKKETNNHKLDESYDAEYSGCYYEKYCDVKAADILSKYGNSESELTNKGIDALIMTMEGYTYKEIAEIKNTTVADIKTAIHTAKNRLRRSKPLYDKLKAGTLAETMG